jgi:nucleotide-binding universal stress UspA family protein
VTPSESSRPVVVGIDGSKAALQAAIWAVDEALTRDVPLRLIATVQHGMGSDGHLDDAAPEVEYARNCLRDASAAIEPTGASVTVDTAILAGPAEAALIAESREASLLVVGSVGIGRVAKTFLGSTAAEVAAHAYCPVAVIRDHGTLRRPDFLWIAVGTTAVRDDQRAVEAALREAQVRGVPLLVVGVWDNDFGPTPYDELDRRVAEWQERYPDVHIHPVTTRSALHTFLEVYDEPVGLAVLSEVDSYQLPDLIGPNAHPLREHAQCSVLIAR